MKFQFDPRNLPEELKSPDGTTTAQDDFVQAVQDKLKDSGSPVKQDDPLLAAIVGMLVLDGYANTQSDSFENGFWTIRGEASGDAPDSNEPKEKVYRDVATHLGRLSGHKQIAYYQEVADISRRMLANTDSVPVGSATFLTQIRAFDDEYVAKGPQASGTLDLPDLTGVATAGSPDDIRSDNVQSVAIVLAASNLEQARLFEVVDRVVETWWNGQLPVGFGAGSRALDKYYWSSEQRLSEPARHMQYGRVLGMAGGEVSSEVQPNTQFTDLFMRFLASLSEYDRQQRIGDIVGSQRLNSLTLTAEQVRQSGRNLAANASLYGWGGTQFAARRLSDHISAAFEILTQRDIQSAYGVDGPYKVIERVATEQWGAAPNIVKYRTLADAGKKILFLVAKYASVWSGSSGRPLFNDPTSAGTVTAGVLGDGFDQINAHLEQLTKIIAAATSARSHKAAPPAGVAAAASPSYTSGGADISDADRDELLRLAGACIGVQGIKDDTVDQFSQPSEAQYAPSIPTLAPVASSGSNGGAGLDQLRQMVAQGQVPSMDQLKSLVMPGSS
jgi:hypothetical protein